MDEEIPLLSTPKTGTGSAAGRWRSIYITYFGTFATYIQMSIYWSSLWPYLTQLDPSTPTTFFGIIVAIYSLGSVVSAPCFGYWSSYSKTTKVPMIAGFVLNIVGNLTMVFVEEIPVAVGFQRYLILAARFTSGFGAGNNGVARAFLSHASTLDERSKVMGYQAAVLSSTVLIGPGIAAMLSPVGYPGFELGIIKFNMYTLEAWICTLFSAISAVLYIFVYHDCNGTNLNTSEPLATDVADTELSNDLIGANTSEFTTGQPGTDDIGAAQADYTSGRNTPNNSEISFDDLKTENASVKLGTKSDKINYRAALCCISVRFVILFCVVYDDTIGSPFTMLMFSWTRDQAVLYNGIIQASSGVLDFVGNIFVGSVLLRYVGERATMMAGLCSFLLFFLFTFSWPTLPLLIASNATTGSAFQNFSIDQTMINISGEHTAIQTSCAYTWCTYTTRISLVAYVIGYVFLFLAFCTAFTPASTLYSKILGSQHQGFLQGLYSAAGSLASMVSPLIVSALFQSAGPRVCWIVAMMILVSCISLLSANYKQLVPPKHGS